jgi:predicted AAA+ superfamily ATPase
VHVVVIFTVKMTSMYARLLAAPKSSFFLFGPRGTGKSTWLRSQLAGALVIDLLEERRRFEYMRNPSVFYETVVASKASWVVVDEVQQVPGLLNEVHRLMEDHRFKFALSGSSARKLRRGQANLLGGRAVVKNMYPLTWEETGGRVRDLDVMLDWGGLPLVLRAEEGERVDVLHAYVSTYLREEIQAEALVRNLASFSRFMLCAGLANAQVTNVSSLSRDAGVQRTTVNGYFEILADTLVGRFLPAWRGKAKVKEQAHPKFYWFDSGVARAMADRLQGTLENESRGALLETFVLQELRAHLHYRRLPENLFFWRTPSGSEVDFVWQSGKDMIAIEVKAATKWRAEDYKGLTAFQEHTKGVRCFGVYRGTETREANGTTVLPLPRFLERLAAGKIFT